MKDGEKLPKGWFKTPGLVMNQQNVDQIIQREQSPQNSFNWYKPQIDRLLANVNGNLEPLSSAR